MFDAKTVVITGAGGGLGRELAFQLGVAGAKIYGTDISQDSLDDLREAGVKRGVSIETKLLDVTNGEEVQTLADEIAHEQRHIDFWFNNAGITVVKNFLNTDPKEYEKVLNVNLNGVINGTRVALRSMEKRGSGTIVNIASIAGHLPSPFMTSYNTSKHAVVGFTRSLQSELKVNGSPVKLMLVSPGFVDTAIINKGDDAGFPDWLTWMLGSPSGVANEMIQGIKKGRAEIYPTWNGKLMRKMYSFLPRTTVNSSRIMFTKSLKDLLLNKIDVPSDLSKPDL